MRATSDRGQRARKELLGEQRREDARDRGPAARRRQRGAAGYGRCRRPAQYQKEETSQLQERLLRISAEYDNFRKRSTKEKDGIYAEGVAGTVTQFIDVLDNLERALAASETEDDFTKGIAMVVTQFKAALEKLGVTEVDPAGGSFDPNLHNAVMHIEDDELGEGAIVDVFQKGYVMGDRVIRYAMVKVAN